MVNKTEEEYNLNSIFRAIENHSGNEGWNYNKTTILFNIIIFFVDSWCQGFDYYLRVENSKMLYFYII